MTATFNIILQEARKIIVDPSSEIFKHVTPNNGENTPTERIKISNIKSVEIYLQSHCPYDKQGSYLPCEGVFRCVIELKDYMNPALLLALAIVENQNTTVALNLVCCQAFDHIHNEYDLSEHIKVITGFTEWVLNKKGTIKFSDFALILVNDVCSALNIESPIEKIVSDIDSDIQINFNANLLENTNIMDLQILGRLVPNGVAKLFAMPYTRRMIPKEKCDNCLVVFTTSITHIVSLKECVSVDLKSGKWERADSSTNKEINNIGIPILFIINHSLGGKIILFSLHFCELCNIKEAVDPQQIIKMIQILHGDLAVEDFKKRLASCPVHQYDTIMTEGTTKIMMSSTSTPSPHDIFA